MTEKQKKALKILTELWYVSHNDGLSKLRDEDYYLLVECILDNDNDYPMDKEWKDYFKKNIVNVPFVRKEPWAQCYTPDGTCNNTFHDCIGCPKHFGSGGTTITTTDDQIARPYKIFGFDMGYPKGDIGIKEEQ